MIGLASSMGVTKKLLWTNPDSSIGQGYGNHTFDFDITGYDAFLIESAYYNTRISAHQYSIIKSSTTNQTIAVATDNAGSLESTERDYRIINSKLTCSNGYEYTTVNPLYCVPIKIYGITGLKSIFNI
jgi:hypothetical protein